MESSTTVATTAEEEVWEVVTRLNSAWLRQDWESLPGLFHSSASLVLPGWASVVQGREVVSQSFKDFASVCDVQEFLVESKSVQVASVSAVASFSYSMVYVRDFRAFSCSGRDIYMMEKEDTGWKITWRTMVDMEESPLVVVTPGVEENRRDITELVSHCNKEVQDVYGEDPPLPAWAESFLATQEATFADAEEEKEEDSGQEGSEVHFPTDDVLPECTNGHVLVASAGKEELVGCLAWRTEGEGERRNVRISTLACALDEMYVAKELLMAVEVQAKRIGAASLLITVCGEMVALVTLLTHCGFGAAGGSGTAAGTVEMRKDLAEEGLR